MPNTYRLVWFTACSTFLFEVWAAGIFFVKSVRSGAMQNETIWVNVVVIIGVGVGMMMMMAMTMTTTTLLRPCLALRLTTIPARG